MATNASQLLKEYKQYNPNAYAAAIEKEYNKRTNYNKDLIEQQNALRGEQIALPSQLRNEYYASPIRNALQQEALIGQRQGNVQSQLGSVTDLLNARGQQYSDILGKAQTGYSTNMENAWRIYQDAVNREEAAKNRAAQLQAALASVPKYTEPKPINPGADLGVQVETSQFANPRTGQSDQISKLLETANAFRNAKKEGGWSAGLGSLYQNAGMNIFNPFYWGSLKGVLDSKDVNLSPSNFLTSRGLSGSKNFSSIYKDVNKKK